MVKYSKKEKKKLRELVGLAYERELEKALKILNESFKKWENGKLDSYKLSEEIHLFHNGTAQDLYKKYNYNDPDIIVAWAINNEILKKDEIGTELVVKLETIIDMVNMM